MNKTRKQIENFDVGAAHELYIFIEHAIAEAVQCGHGVKGTISIPYYVVMQNGKYKSSGAKLKCTLVIDWDGESYGVDKKAGKTS